MKSPRLKREDDYREIRSHATGDNDLREHYRRLCLNDLYFLAVVMCKRPDMRKDWIFERCQEVQESPNFHLDLWAREHYKSTIITFSYTIQDILYDPEITIGLFSVTRPISKSFLYQIRKELSDNTELKWTFPDVLWANPWKEAPRWSLDEGLLVKREGNPKESTIEAHGLTDSMPTGRHFKVRLYDDVITERHVTNPDMIRKATQSWELSLNLGSAQPTKRYKEVDIERYIGTRYHFNDPYKEIMKRGAAKQRIYPGTDNGQMDGNPVLWTPDFLAKKRRNMGRYVFACHGAGTLITMGDWSQKPIEEVQEGDEVVGWARVQGGRTVLTKTLVKGCSQRVAPRVESELENEDRLIHTPDHKWWTGRNGKEKGRERKEYSELGFGYGQQSALCQAVDLSFLKETLTEEQQAAAGYLAGMIDGEGGVNCQVIQISQDALFHPEVCEKIEWALNTLNFEYSIFDRKDNQRAGTARFYTILGGRQARIRLLHYNGLMLGKKERIVSQCYGSRNFGTKNRISLKAQRPMPDGPVYNIQTETGNYIANGYCSKNCQILQNPKADDNQGFDKAWLRYWQPDNTTGLNLYLLCDPAGEKRPENDYTSMGVLGLGPDGNTYVVFFMRDRLNLTERTQWLMHLHRTYAPLATGYEKYGKDSDIEHIETVQERENYRFDIIPLGGTTKKNDRIKRLVPDFEYGRFYLPFHCFHTNYEEQRLDMTKVFVDEEYEPFPVGLHDDMFDMLARIKDPDLGARYPKIKKDSYGFKRRSRKAKVI